MARIPQVASTAAVIVRRRFTVDARSSISVMPRAYNKSPA